MAGSSVPFVVLKGYHMGSKWFEEAFKPVTVTACQKNKDEGAVWIDEMKFAPFKDCDLYDFMNTLGTQLVSRAALDYKAIGTALGEIFSGLGTMMGTQVRKGYRFMRGKKKEKQSKRKKQRRKL